MLKIFGDHDKDTQTQAANCIAAGAAEFVLCADGHKGYGFPIGGVGAFPVELVSPSGVGFDIGCGNLALETDADAEEVRGRIGAIMDEVWSTVSFGMGRKNKEPVDHALFDDDAWREVKALKPLKDLARGQLGTVGGGNHYVDIFVDEREKVWVGVHFGSRGLGHKVATYFLEALGSKDDMMAPPAVLNTASSLGSDYLEAMRVAGDYAHAGREWVAARVVGLLGARATDAVHNHHNYAWKENHRGTDYWVIRKGATPAFPGQRGFVGGSMGDDAVILEGVESELSAQSLYSTVHGAGRVMSRTAAKGKSRKDPATGKWVRGVGAVRRDDMIRWIADKGVTLRGADLDEAPQAYRRLPDVLRAHEGTIRILHTLRPIGVAMADQDDPYKD